MPKTLIPSSKKQPDNFKRTKASETYGLIYHQAFDNTLQANIISNFNTGKIIIANSAACKLLGYSKKELLTKSRNGIFDINEDSFKKKLRQISGGEGKSTISVKFIKKTGKVFSCEITSAIFIDENAIEKVITNITNKSLSILNQKKIDVKKDKKVAADIVLAKGKQKLLDIKKDKKVADDIVLVALKQKKIDKQKEKSVANDIIVALATSDAKIDQNNQWIKYIAKSSYDIMWDWDITNGQIYVGDSVKEIFGYTLKNDMASFKDFSNLILSTQKKEVLKKINKSLASKSNSWKDSFSFRRLDGSIASTTSRASIVRDAKGNATHLIGAIKDVSEIYELESKLKEQIIEKKEHRNIINIATRLSYDGIWDWNILTNKFFLSDGFEKLFGISFHNIKNGKLNWTTFIHPDDKEMVEQGMQLAIGSSANKWEQAYRFIKDDGSVLNVFGRANIIRDGDDKAYRMIGVIHDITNQTMLEEKLATEIKLKELQIAEATEDAKENERSDIGKELHDNINQLLGASKLYIDMAKKGGSETQAYLSRSSEYTMKAIEEIRKLTKGLTTDFIQNIGLCPAIKKLADDMSEVNPAKISCAFKSFMENSVNNKFKITVFRIIQEQMNNIFKHANATKINITLLQNKQSVMLSISDNGVGFDTAKESEGIGVANIKSRTIPYKGTIKLISNPGEGCVLNAIFPLTKLILN